MGQRITQRILECDLCNKIPKNGDNMWQMGNELWCEECCNKEDEEDREKEEDE